MLQADQSTAAQLVNPQGEPSSFDTAPTTEDLFQNADEAVRLALLHERRTALTVSADDREVASQPVSAFREQNEENLSRLTFREQNEENLSRLTFREQNEENLSRILAFPQMRTRRAPAVTLHALQEWEGYVLEISATDFVAHLIDLTVGSPQEEEEAVIPLTEISDDDVVKIRKGSIFRWVIGYERSVAGTKKRVSQIVFRDLPAMTKSDLQDGRAWADQISESFNR